MIQGQTPNHIFCFNECQDYWAAEESGVNHTSFKELLTLARLNARIKSTLLSRNFKIVNISSINAWRPAKKNQLYDSLKAALNNLTEGLALEYLEHGVRVNALLPGGFKTPLVEKWLELYLDRVPNDQDFESPSVGSAERVAQGVLALISTELSWINGALLPIDGGYRLT